MSQPAFLIRGFKGRLVQTDDVLVQRVKKYRVTGSMDFGPLGTARMTEATGQYEAHRLTIAPDHRTRSVLANGARASSGDGYVKIKRSAAGVKAVVRRLRDQEAAALDAFDAEIERVKTVLADLRAERDTAAHVAWAKANVVRLAEIEERLR